MKLNNIIAVACVLLITGACGNKTHTGSTESKTEVVNGVATSTFKVWGNCNMCKETIEGALKVDGISGSDWDADTKMMVVSYDSAKISLDQIQRNIALAGYDDELYKGDDKAYHALPECCQYERK